MAQKNASARAAELREVAQSHEETADAIEALADRLGDAESIADDVPVLSELFHRARTSRREDRDGRYTALLDYDADADEWTCRTVSFLERGTHWKDTGATVAVSQKPWPFLSVDRFAEQIKAALERSAEGERKSAASAEESARRLEVRAD